MYGCLCILNLVSIFFFGLYTFHCRQNVLTWNVTKFLDECNCHEVLFKNTTLGKNWLLLKSDLSVSSSNCLLLRVGIGSIGYWCLPIGVVNHLSYAYMYILFLVKKLSCFKLCSYDKYTFKFSSIFIHWSCHVDL